MCPRQARRWLIFVGNVKAGSPPIRWCRMAKPCPHDGFHGIRTVYDRDRGLLRFFWTCEDCEARLSEAHRAEYSPRFKPRGNDPYIQAVGLQK